MDILGVLGKKYSDERTSKPALKFRLLYRAYTIRVAADTYLKKTINLNILDMGAAEGKTIIAMSEFLPQSHFVGIEFSRELIKEAPAFSPNIELIEGDATRLPDRLEDESFDIVTALAVLEHLKAPSDAASEAFRVLKPGGIFVATCPVPAWDTLSARVGLLDECQHENKVNQEKMVHLVGNAGFEVLEYRRFMWAPASFLPYLNIPLSPMYAARIDRFISLFRVFNWLFVNQRIVGRKP
jgi:ubiquinone/menaquinone biosynthesis C-methylase UbiE